MSTPGIPDGIYTLGFPNDLVATVIPDSQPFDLDSPILLLPFTVVPSARVSRLLIPRQLHLWVPIFFTSGISRISVTGTLHSRTLPPTNSLGLLAEHSWTRFVSSPPFQWSGASNRTSKQGDSSGLFLCYSYIRHLTWVSGQTSVSCLPNWWKEFKSSGKSRRTRSPHPWYVLSFQKHCKID